MPGLAGPFISSAVVGFLKRHPKAYVSVAARSSQFVADWLLDSQLDVSIISMRIDHRHFEAEALISLPLVCVMHNGNRIEKKKRITPRALVLGGINAFGEGRS